MAMPAWAQSLKKLLLTRVVKAWATSPTKLTPRRPQN